MWCIECGAKLVDGAKFCMNCGTKIPEIEKKDETFNPKGDIKEEKDPVEQFDTAIKSDDAHRFNLLGYSVSIPKSTDMYVKIRSLFANMAYESSEQFEDYYINKYRNFEGLIKMADKDMRIFMDKAYSEGLEILNSLGLYNVNYERFLGICDNYTGYWDEEFGGLYDKYCELMDYKSNQQEYRRQRKAGRGRMVGGGFGFSGAVKGMAMAGSMNAASGIFHSMANAMGNAATSAEISSAMSKLYKSEETKITLSDAVYSDIFYVFHAVVEAINASGKYPQIVGYSSEEMNEASILYENVMNGKVRDEDLRSTVFDVLYKYPFLRKHYRIALELFGDENNQIEEYANFFDVDITDIKNEIKAKEENHNRLIGLLGKDFIDFDNYLSDNEIYIKIKNQLTEDLYKNIIIAYNSLDSSVRSKLFLLSQADNDKVRTKLFNAKTKYANCGSEVPVLLFDNTAFGSANDGFLITRDTIYVHNMMEKPWSASINSINNLGLSSKKIKFNDYFADMTIIDDKHTGQFYEFIQILIGTKFFFGSFGEYERNSSHHTPDAESETAVAVAAQAPTVNNDPGDYSSAVSYIRETVINLKKPSIKELLFVLDESQEANVRFNNAKNSYLCLGDNEECILIFDNTAFKSGKDGFVLTNKSIQYHNMWTKPGIIYYKDINNVDTIQLSSSDLIINGKNINITLVPKAVRFEFKELITNFISRLK